jgi:hypothetical protein
MTRATIRNSEPKPWAVEFYNTTTDDAEMINVIEVDIQDEAFAIAARNQARHGDLIIVRERKDIYLEEYATEPGQFRWVVGEDTEVHDDWVEAFA